MTFKSTSGRHTTRFGDPSRARVNRVTRRTSQWFAALLAVAVIAVPAAVMAQAPDWQVDPESFDASMTATAIVFVDGTPALHPDNLIAAFAGAEVRGVSRSTFFAGDQLFFLTIFGDAEGAVQNFTFKIYDAALDQVRDINESIEFESNVSLGELNRPYSLSVGSLGNNRPAWEITAPGAFDQNMSVTASVLLDGIPATHPGNMVAAFAGAELRAVASPVWITGRQVYFLSVLGDTAITSVNFQIYDAASGELRAAAETVNFEADASVGSIAQPFLLTEGFAGVNRPVWEVADTGGFEATMSIAATVFADGAPSTSTNNLLAVFSGTEVRGVASPRLVNGVQMFYLTVFGDATTGPLTFDFYDADSDAVVDINEQLTFEVDGSIGSIEVPLLLTSGPTPTNTPGWSVDPTDYSSTMSVAATLFVDGLPSSNPKNLIAAFEGESVRGVASPTFVNGTMLFYLTVYANTDGELLTFRAFDAGSDRVRLLRETVTFRDNDRLGDTKEPFVLSTVKDAVDIAVEKSADVTNPTVGSEVEFVVTASNVGAQQATGVVVTDAEPTGMTFFATSPSRGTYSAATGQWSIGTLDAGQSASLTVTATVNLSGAITNIASLTTTDQPDINPGNNAVSVTVGGDPADLQVTKLVDRPSANVGDQVTFTATVRNNGPSTATNITVADQVSAGLRIDGATPGQGSFDPATTIWSVGDLASGTEATIIVLVTVLSAGPQSNTATITGSGTADPDASNNSATATVSGEQVDIAVTKAVDNVRPSLGATITFTITTTNNGPSAATGVAIRDVLPEGLAFSSATASAGAYSNASGEWVIGSLAVGAPATLTISARVDSTGVLVNTASLQAVDQPDTDSSNDKATAVVSGQQIDLAITKTASSDKPNVGEEVTFTVTLTNNGPGRATGVKVTDVETPGLSFGEVTTESGAYDAASGVWTVAQLPAGASVALTVVAVVDSAGDVTNTASITGSDQPDPDPSNDSESRTVEGQIVDISLTKTVDRPSATPADSVIFTITARNSGPSVATGIEVTDELPAGLVLRGSAPSVGTFNPLTLRWSVPGLGVGEQQTLQLTTMVETTGSYTNTVSVATADQPDSDPSNDRAEATIVSESVDLGVTKTVDNASPDVGTTVVFTIALTNGPTTATGIEVTDVAPAGLVLADGSTATGAFNAATGVWTVDSLGPSEQATLEVTALVTRAGETTNAVRITAIDQHDTDPSNDEASVAISAASTPTLSGVIRDVVFRSDGTGSVLQNPSLASAAVEILVDGIVMEQGTTDATGLFSFAITGPADRVIRITASGTVPETNEPVVVVKEIPVTDGSRAYVIPLSIAIQKLSLIHELENLLIPSSVLTGGGDSVPLVSSYDESATAALMETWLANVGPERDSIIQGIARLVFAELVLSDVYTNAVWMSHETADVVFQLVRAFLITQGIADEIRDGVDEELLTVLEQQTIGNTYGVLRRLVKEIFLDAPIEEAAAKLPSLSGPLLAGTLQAILAEASAISVLDRMGDMDAYDQITTAGDQKLLGWYVEGTQTDLDRGVGRADSFDTAGASDEAYDVTRAIVASSDQATAAAHRDADSLQARTNLDDIVDGVIPHRQRPHTLVKLVGLYESLREKKVSYLGLSIVSTMRRLENIEAVDAAAGIDASFDARVPSASVALSTVSKGVSGSSEPVETRDLSLSGASMAQTALSTEAYRLAAAEIAQLASEGRKAEAIARYDPLIALENDLTLSLRVAQAPIIAAAINAAGAVTNFDEALASMIDVVTETAVERAVFYAQLLQYAGDPLFSADSLGVQVNSLISALDAAERQVNDLAALISGVESRPYVVVLSIGLNNDRVSLDDTLTVSAVIQNVGVLPAEGVTAMLRTDASAVPFTTTTIDIGTLAAAQQQTTTWSMQIVDTTRASGSFQVELTSNNALTVSSTGSYSFAPVSVGVEQIPGDVPTQLALFQSYPNPFSSNTTFHFANPGHQHVALTIFDVVGRQIAVVISETLPAGNFFFPFRAGSLASGMYFLRLQAGSKSTSGKMVIVR